MAEYFEVFTSGALIFGLVVMLWRGWTHWSMLACGCACFTLMYIISAVLGIAAVLLTEVGGYYAAVIIALIITAVVFGAKKIGILNDR